MRRARIVGGFAIAMMGLVGSAVAQPLPPPGEPAPVAPPTPEQISEAREHFERAMELYKSGDFKIALVELQRAYAIAPSYKILYNIAQANRQLSSYAAAYNAYAQYLEQGGDDIPADRRLAVEEELSGLRMRTAKLRVLSNVEGAEIRIDNVQVATTPLVAPLLVDAGEHTVTVVYNERSASKPVTLSGAEELTLEVPLAAPEPPPPVVAPPVVAPPPDAAAARPVSVPHVAPDVPSDSGGSALWIGWAATGAFASAAVVTGIFALNAQSELDTLRDPRTQTTGDELSDAESEALALSVTTDVLIGAAVVAGGIALVLTITDGPDDPATMGVRLSPVGATLQGAF